MFSPANNTYSVSSSAARKTKKFYEDNGADVPKHLRTVGSKKEERDEEGYSSSDSESHNSDYGSESDSDYETEQKRTNIRETGKDSRVKTAQYKGKSHEETQEAPKPQQQDSTTEAIGARMQKATPASSMKHEMLDGIEIEKNEVTLKLRPVFKGTAKQLSGSTFKYENDTLVKLFNMGSKKLRDGVKLAVLVKSAKVTSHISTLPIDAYVHVEGAPEHPTLSHEVMTGTLLDTAALAGCYHSNSKPHKTPQRITDAMVLLNNIEANAVIREKVDYIAVSGGFNILAGSALEKYAKQKFPSLFKMSQQNPNAFVGEAEFKTIRDSLRDTVLKANLSEDLVVHLQMQEADVDSLSQMERQVEYRVHVSLEVTVRFFEHNLL